ncbi:twin-arginine translocation signal domain-containing protein [Halorhabdus salina]|uniref:twin-arginine translocation signal domain-containing protein n=1 Tax=Halorhabdus salina TaxID=2750670 RepID=UPI0015EFB9E0|nr:twin-arginine translocation signal domain-containing protein [Halorhabdus salina]
MQKDPSDRTGDGTVRLSRRTFLAGCGTAGLAGLTGCLDTITAVGDSVLKELVVFNNRAAPIDGTLTVDAPTGTRILERSFDLDARSAEMTNGEAMVVYGDVWRDSGRYRIVIERDDSNRREDTRIERSVRIEDPSQQKLGVVFEEGTDRVNMTVAPSFDELHRFRSRR